MATTYPSSASANSEVRQRSYRRTIAVALAVIMVAVVALAARQYLASRITVTVEVDGRATVVHTHARDTTALLQTLGIELQPRDILLTPDDVLEPNSHLTLKRARPIRLHEGGRARSYWTQAQTVGAFLAENNITLADHDILTLAGQPVTLAAVLPAPEWRQPGRGLPTRSWDYAALAVPLAIQRAQRILIHDSDHVPSAIFTTQQTVGDALAAAAIDVYLGDEVFPPLHSRVQPGQHITIRRSLPIQLAVDGRTLSTRTQQTTVADALAEQGLVLLGQDYVTPALDETLSSHARIQITRVREDVLYEDERIPFATVWQPDDNLPIDQRVVANAGQEGVLRQRIRVRYEDGEEVKRELEASWSAAEPQNKVIAYGRKITPQTLETPDGTITYWRRIRAYANSYSPARSGTPKSAPWYGRTRLGMTLEKGVVAVDPSVINLRQRLYVPGYGEAIAGDTGGGVQGKWVDLGYDDASYRSWHWWTDVYLLWPPPVSHSIRYVLPNWPTFPDRG